LIAYAQATHKTRCGSVQITPDDESAQEFSIGSRCSDSIWILSGLSTRFAAARKDTGAILLRTMWVSSSPSSRHGYDMVRMKRDLLEADQIVNFKELHGNDTNQSRTEIKKEIR
jgi:hypothetical protein